MRLIVPTLLTCLVLGCADSDAGSTAEDEVHGATDTGLASIDAGVIDAPSAGTSLRQEVMPIIDQTCGGCHTRTDAPFPPAVANDVYYDDADDLMALVGTFIIAGDAAGSGFVAILTQDLPVGQGPTLMPPPDMADAMVDEAIEIVRAWIDEGAQDN